MYGRDAQPYSAVNCILLFHFYCHGQRYCLICFIVISIFKAQAAFLSGQLLNLHVNEWNSIWQKGRIDVKGDVTIARHNYGTLYYLLSSLPSNGNRKDWPFIGLSPGGLAHGIEGKVSYVFTKIFTCNAYSKLQKGFSTCGSRSHRGSNDLLRGGRKIQLIFDSY